MISAAETSPLRIVREAGDETITVRVTVNKALYDVAKKKARLEGRYPGDVMSEALVFYYQHNQASSVPAQGNGEGSR